MTATERRIARFARRAAKLELELRHEGAPEAAARFEAAIEAVERMRRGLL